MQPRTKIEGHSVKDICDGYRNKFDVQDAPRSGRPLTSATEQTIDAVLTIIEGDPHSTYQQIETILGISSTAINSTIHDYLNLRKVCARWVPFEEGQSRRIFDVITGNESWFYHYDPELKEQSKVWMSTTDPRPTKVYRNKSAGKRMVAIFFVKSGLIKFVPLETGATVNATAGMSTHAYHKSSQPYLNEEKREVFEVSFFMSIMQGRTEHGLPMNFCWKIT
ncbi:unnamed protein product [Rotaria magnacalcarata]|uniref:Transposase n=1 Tax=Rotaria magnacalcarata TaxID=392030 RepID=A0A817AH04_9BILA|nr:unnamed protein product [Rotaria magnacalcarata]